MDERKLDANHSPLHIDIPEDLPVEKRKLAERMTYGGGFRGDTVSDLAINAAFLGKALLNIILDEKKDGFRLVIYYDKKSEPQRGRTKLYELISPERLSESPEGSPDEPGIPAEE